MLKLITDPHLGYGARTNTSAKSSVVLDAKLYQTAKQLVAGDEEILLCGDLFHRSHNKENIIAQGIDIASKCLAVVGGNHDFTNRADDKSSMDIVKEVTGNIIMAEVGKVFVSEVITSKGGETFVVIPHHSSQDLFDLAVDKACGSMADLMVLHCNFNNPFVEDIDTALNLTIEQANKLLLSYRYIVIGHEHNTRKELGGRLLALGNTHPTSFSDISDKYSWTFTKAEGFARTLIWSKEEHYTSLSAEDFLSFDDEDFELGALQFLDITGELDAELMPELARKVGVFWDKVEPLMVRNRVNVVAEDAMATMEEGYKIEDFIKMLREGLTEAPQMLELFDTTVELVSGDAQ
jgi:DNA repair exonuclease SbcCD nuclease subunit